MFYNIKYYYVTFYHMKYYYSNPKRQYHARKLPSTVDIVDYIRLQLRIMTISGGSPYEGLSTGYPNSCHDKKQTDEMYEGYFFF